MLSYKKTLRKIIEHAKQEYPKEACGILIKGNCRTSPKIYQMTNISEEPIKNYLLDPREQVLLFRELNFDENKILAIYHSHISSEPYPSSKDIELAYPNILYLIISLQDFNKPVIKGFKIHKGKIIENPTLPSTSEIHQ